MSDKTPLHQWTHTVDRVLVVKCIAKDGNDVDESVALDGKAVPNA